MIRRIVSIYLKLYLKLYLTFCLTLSLCLSLFPLSVLADGDAHSAVVISEVMASNGTWTGGHAYDWIELHKTLKKTVTTPKSSPPRAQSSNSSPSWTTSTAPSPPTQN